MSAESEEQSSQDGVCCVCRGTMPQWFLDSHHGVCMGCDMKGWRTRVDYETKCHYCGKKLVAIGHGRTNGADHADWASRRYHKKCWRLWLAGV